MNSGVEGYRSFISGAFGGLCGILLSHPCDTARVRIQTEGRYMYRGLRDMYRGIGPPLYGVVFEKMVVFGSYSYMSSIVGDSGGGILLSGLFSGLTCSLVVTPVDRVKINLQSSGSRYKSGYDYLRVNGLSGLYRGWTSTLTREVPGYGIYFSVYERLRGMVDNGRGMWYKTFFMGGISGAVSWVFIYPSDVVKSRMQVEGNMDRGVVDCVRGVLKQDGIKGFYRGFHMSLLRAVPLHAGVFMGYEMMNRVRLDY